MKVNWIKVQNAIVGVVYRYYTSDGKSYVGCTTNERKRRYAWNWKNNSYGGVKIATARKEFGLNAFQYERLYIIITESKDGLVKQLEALETLFIKLFDSYNNGFNTSIGGRGSKGNAMPALQKAKIRNSSKKKAVRLIPDDGSSSERIVESLAETARQLAISVGRVSYYIYKSNKSVEGYTLKLVA